MSIEKRPLEQRYGQDAGEILSQTLCTVTKTHTKPPGENLPPSLYEAKLHQPNQEMRSPRENIHIQPRLSNNENVKPPESNILLPSYNAVVPKTSAQVQLCNKANIQSSIQPNLQPSMNSNYTKSKPSETANIPPPLYEANAHQQPIQNVQAPMHNNFNRELHTREHMQLPIYSNTEGKPPEYHQLQPPMYIFGASMHHQGGHVISQTYNNGNQKELSWSQKKYMNLLETAVSGNKTVHDINDHMCLSVFAFLCCCPIGICAIVKSFQARSSFRRGEHKGAKTFSKTANNLAVLPIICGITVIVIYSVGRASSS